MSNATSIFSAFQVMAGRQGILKSAFNSLFVRIAGLASTFLLGVLLARVLGPTGYGLCGLVTTLAALGMSVALLGTPQLAVRELSVRKERNDWDGIRLRIRQFGTAVAVASIVIGLGAALVSAMVSRWDAATMSLAVPGAVLLALMAATALIAAELRGLGLLFKGQAMEIFIRPALVFVLAAAFVAGGFRLSVSLALWVQVLVAFLAALVSVGWICDAVPRDDGQHRLPTHAPWLAMALPLGIVDVLRQLDGAYAMILMGELASNEALGIFRVALACNVVVAMPVTILHIILAPRLGPMHQGKQTAELQTLLSSVSAILTAAVLPIAVAAWLIGRPAIEIVFGQAYGPAGLPLFILCVAQLLFGFFGMGPILLTMCEGERALTGIYVTSVGFGIVAAVPLVLSFGAAGAAGAMIISNSLIGLMSWRYGRSKLGVDCTFLYFLRQRA